MRLLNILKGILREDASDDAHNIGLTYKGHAYWQDKSGKTVAKTVDNVLTKLSPEEMEAHEKQQHAPNDAQRWRSAAHSQQPQQTAPAATKEVLTFTKGHSPQGVLNGVPFQSWQAPKEDAAWKGVAGTNPNINEPELDDHGMRRAAGVIIMEPDGRVWVVEPAGHYGGYEHTFPKGGQSRSRVLDLQETAIKEAWEESGLKVDITGFLGDYERTTSVSRYYVGKRTGGTPVDFDKETQSVKLVPMEQLDNYLNMPIDRQIRADLEKYAKSNPQDAQTPPADTPKPQVQPPEDLPLDASTIMGTLVGRQKGSNTGGFYKGKDGVLRYVKLYNDPSRSESEKLTSEIYRDLGLGAPKAHTFEFNGRTAYASDIIPGKELREVGLTPQIADKLLDGFVADIFTANWDAIGMEDDNVIVDNNGDVHRIDHGGALIFRAMEDSGRKEDHFLDDIKEFDRFANPERSYSKLFQKAGYTDANSIKDRVIKGINDIAKLYKSSGGWANYVESKAPEMDPTDKRRIVQMLDSRLKKLLERGAKMQHNSQD